MNKTIPLSLYVHLPWCVKKCPYCDFNSYGSDPNQIPFDAYIQRLFQDLSDSLPLIAHPEIVSIFFGGGTPSLFSPQSFEKIINHVYSTLSCDPNLEITMEANPGTLEHKSFKDYGLAGINRVSLGAQSFQNHFLESLGRIHEAREIEKAIDSLHHSGITNFNIDVMYGLPNQTVEEALYDLNKALSFQPTHLSWYHLTLEPNTIFYHKPPPLPLDDLISDIQDQGHEILRSSGYQHYEVSAFSKSGFNCRHNRNYWEFGDYLGIGAGAHSKITHLENKTIERQWKVRYPKSYLNPESPLVAGTQEILPQDRVFEFMLNALRLTDGFSLDLFEARTFCSLSMFDPILNKAKENGFIQISNNIVKPTEHGKKFLNNLLELFLNDSSQS